MDISFKGILQVVKKSIVVVLIISVIVGVGAYFGTSLLIKPSYNTAVKLFVNTNVNAQTSYEDLNQHNYAQTMVATYIQILDTNHFYEMVAAELPDKYNASMLKRAISFSQIEETEVFKAIVTADDPLVAKTIADAVAKTAPATIKEQYEDKVTLKIVDEAQFPKYPASPNPKRNAIIAFLGTALLCFMIAFIKEYFDVKIKYNNEITELCGLPVLTAIPEFTQAPGKANQGGEQDA